MLERIEKLLNEAKAQHYAKIQEHQRAEAALPQFQAQVNNLAVQTMLLEARVNTLQEVYDGEKAKASQGQAEEAAGGPQGEGGPAAGSPS